MSTYLSKREGTYTPGRRFALSNTTSEEFKSKWNGIPIVVKPGDTIEISDTTPIPGSGMGECLGFKMARELVDGILIKKKVGLNLGVPEYRKFYEEQVLKELQPEEEFTLKILNQQKIAEIVSDASKQEGVSYEPQAEFSEIPKGSRTVEIKPPKKAATTKKI